MIPILKFNISEKNLVFRKGYTYNVIKNIITRNLELHNFRVNKFSLIDIFLAILGFEQIKLHIRHFIYSEDELFPL